MPKGDDCGGRTATPRRGGNGKMIENAAAMLGVDLAPPSSLLRLLPRKMSNHAKDQAILNNVLISAHLENFRTFCLEASYSKEA